MDLLRPDDHPGVALAAKYAVARLPWLASIKHHWCPLCDEDHAKSYRQFAHHVCQSDVICWAMAMKDLEPEFAAGIALHEYGHILAGGEPGESDFEAEREADRAAMEQLGVEMQYVGPLELQWVDLGSLES